MRRRTFLSTPMAALIPAAPARSGQIVLPPMGSTAGGVLALAAMSGQSMGWAIGAKIAAQFGPAQRFSGPRLADCRLE